MRVARQHGHVKISTLCARCASFHLQHDRPPQHIRCVHASPDDSARGGNTIHRDLALPMPRPDRATYRIAIARRGLQHCGRPAPVARRRIDSRVQRQWDGHTACYTIDRVRTASFAARRDVRSSGPSRQESRISLRRRLSVHAASERQTLRYRTRRDSSRGHLPGTGPLDTNRPAPPIRLCSLETTRCVMPLRRVRPTAGRSPRLVPAKVAASLPALVEGARDER